MRCPELACKCGCSWLTVASKGGGAQDTGMGCAHSAASTMLSSSPTKGPFESDLPEQGLLSAIQVSSLHNQHNDQQSRRRYCTAVTS